MEALKDQLAEHGGNSTVLTRADFRGGRLVGGASRRKPADGGGRATGAPQLSVQPIHVQPTTAAIHMETGLAEASAPRMSATATPVRSAVPATTATVPELPFSAAAVLGQALALANTTAGMGPGSLAMAGYVEAADFAGQVEDLSRTVEYLQVLAAGAVERTRSRAIADAAWPAGAAPTETVSTPAAQPVVSSPADDGCANTSPSDAHPPPCPAPTAQGPRARHLH